MRPSSSSSSPSAPALASTSSSAAPPDSDSVDRICQCRLGDIKVVDSSDHWGGSDHFIGEENIISFLEDFLVSVFIKFPPSELGFDDLWHLVYKEVVNDSGAMTTSERPDAWTNVMYKDFT